jgi:hypothetical protein
MTCVSENDPYYFFRPKYLLFYYKWNSYVRPLSSKKKKKIRDRVALTAYMSCDRHAFTHQLQADCVHFERKYLYTNLRLHIINLRHGDG